MMASGAPPRPGLAPEVRGNAGAFARFASALQVLTSAGERRQPASSPSVRAEDRGIRGAPGERVRPALDRSAGRTPILPRRPLPFDLQLGRPAAGRFKTVKPVLATRASHLNFVAADTWAARPGAGALKVQQIVFMSLCLQEPRENCTAPPPSQGNPGDTSGHMRRGKANGQGGRRYGKPTGRG